MKVQRTYSPQMEARLFLRWLREKESDPESITPASIDSAMRTIQTEPRRLSRELLKRSYWESDDLDFPDEHLHDVAGAVGMMVQTLIGPAWERA